MDDRSPLDSETELSGELDHKLVEKLGVENEKLKALTATLKKNVSTLETEIKLRKDIELQLAQAQKMEALGQLAAGIAHEVNTPAQFIGDHLQFIKEAIEEILNEGEEQGGLSEFNRKNLPLAIDCSIEGVQRIGEIVASMRRFSHQDSGSEKKSADINQSVQDSLSVSRNEWKNIATAKAQLAPDLPSVPCLLGEVNQVLLNLIINATHAISDFKEKGKLGRIILRTKQVADYVQIEVEDDGGGIPKNIQERIFDPFFTTKELGKGTGQGLALAHSVIVKKHGGRLTFETKQGVGTTFFIFLPIAAEKIFSSEIPYCKGWPKQSV
ncbi:MAG: ATP-binding protein [Opitutales bacterium]|nr:ATP-binding protein [Opitutales bacterium]